MYLEKGDLVFIKSIPPEDAYYKNKEWLIGRVGRVKRVSFLHDEYYCGSIDVPIPIPFFDNKYYEELGEYEKEKLKKDLNSDISLGDLLMIKYKYFYKVKLEKVDNGYYIEKAKRVNELIKEIGKNER